MCVGACGFVRTDAVNYHIAVKQILVDPLHFKILD